MRRLAAIAAILLASCSAGQSSNVESRQKAEGVSKQIADDKLRQRQRKMRNAVRSGQQGIVLRQSDPWARYRKSNVDPLQMRSAYEARQAVKRRANDNKAETGRGAQSKDKGGK